MSKIYNGIFILFFYILHLSSPCAPGKVQPATDIQTATGDGNNSFSSETLYHSVKSVANINVTGAAGALITLSAVFCMFVIAYKRLSVFLHLVNDRLHCLAELFGIHGFNMHQPAIDVEKSEKISKTETEV